MARSTGHGNYITVVNKGGCYSMVGYLHRNHEVSLRIGGCTYHGIAAHELGHTIGKEELGGVLGLHQEEAFIVLTYC